MDWICHFLGHSDSNRLRIWAKMCLVIRGGPVSLRYIADTLVSRHEVLSQIRWKSPVPLIRHLRLRVILRRCIVLNGAAYSWYWHTIRLFKVNWAFVSILTLILQLAKGRLSLLSIGGHIELNGVIVVLFGPLFFTTVIERVVSLRFLACEQIIVVLLFILTFFKDDWIARVSLSNSFIRFKPVVRDRWLILVALLEQAIVK